MNDISESLFAVTKARDTANLYGTCRVLPGISNHTRSTDEVRSVTICFVEHDVRGRLCQHDDQINRADLWF